MRETWVRSLVRGDLPCCGAAEAVDRSHPAVVESPGRQLPKPDALVPPLQGWGRPGLRTREEHRAAEPRRSQK